MIPHSHRFSPSCIFSLFLIAITVAVVLLAGTQQTSAQNLPGLQLWLKADAGISENVDGVSVWADQSGNSRDATAAPGEEPVRIASEPLLGGMPTLRFDGDLDLLTIANRILADDEPEFTVFAVATAGQPSNASIFSIREGSNLLQLDTQGGGEPNLGRSRFIARTGPPNVTVNSLGEESGTVEADGSWTVTPAIYAGTLTANGTERTALVYFGGIAGDSATADFGAATSITVGAQQIGGVNCCGQLNWKGDIAEILVYDRALSGAEYQSVEVYLEEKYGIPEPGGLTLCGVVLAVLLLRLRPGLPGARNSS